MSVPTFGRARISEISFEVPDHTAALRGALKAAWNDDCGYDDEHADPEAERERAEYVEEQSGALLPYIHTWQRAGETMAETLADALLLIADEEGYVRGADVAALEALFQRWATAAFVLQSEAAEPLSAEAPLVFEQIASSSDDFAFKVEQAQPVSGADVRDYLAGLFRAAMPSATTLKIKVDEAAGTLVVAAVLDSAGRAVEPEFLGSEPPRNQVAGLCARLAQLDGLEPQTIQLRER